LAPLWLLLSTKNEFLWIAEHDAAVANTNNSTCASINRPIRLCTDASRQGLGFIMQQQGQNEVWQLVQAGSQCLTEAESRYAVVELELLVVLWAMWKCNIYLAGLHFEVLIDHNPLGRMACPLCRSFMAGHVTGPPQVLRTKVTTKQDEDKCQVHRVFGI